jgi:hypothetical protein
MDILLLIILVEFISLLLYFIYAEVYFLLSTLIFLLYGVLKYQDGDEYTGFRSWGWLRRRTLFGKSVKYLFGNPVAFKAEHARDRTLFIVVGNVTHMGLIHGFAMHGGTFQHLDLVVMMPWILFKIPLLRDILLWMGCVATPLGSADSVDTQILHLLRKGKSVVCTLNSSALLEFAIVNKILIVPVLIKGEAVRYWTLPFPYMGIQQWFQARIGWPFPYFFFPRIFSKKPLERLTIQIGTPMDASVQENAEKFSTLFMGQFCEV